MTTTDDPVATLERPATRAPASGLPLGWSVLGANGALALQSQSPIVAMIDKLYVYGGKAEPDSQVLVSSDGGQSWGAVEGRLQPVAAPAGAAFRDRLWLVGGLAQGDPLGDAFSSLDGQGWALQSSYSRWAPRWGHGVAVFNDKLHVIAGMNGQGQLGDVWRFETDPGSGMSVWNPVGGFAPRLGPAVGVVGGALVVMGGTTPAGALAEVLTSPDGATWTSHTPPWTARGDAAAATVGDTLYLIGGRDGYRANGEVWATQDGVDWQKIEGETVFDDIYGHGAAVVGDHIVVAGGVVDGQYNRQAFAFRPFG